MRFRSVAFWITVFVAALWLNATFAQEIDMTQDGWVFTLPAASSGWSVSAAPSGYGGGVEQWRPAVEGACGGDPSCVNWMLTTIACESGGDPGAVGYYGEVGILQFRPDGLWGAIWDPGTQIAIAADAYYSGLRHHWVCSPW